MTYTAHLHGGPHDGTVDEVGYLTSDARPNVVKAVVHRTESAYRKARFFKDDDVVVIENGYIVHKYFLSEVDTDDVGHYYHREPKHPALVNGVL